MEKEIYEKACKIKDNQHLFERILNELTCDTIDEIKFYRVSECENEENEFAFSLWATDHGNFYKQTMNEMKNHIAAYVEETIKNKIKELETQFNNL
jgi:uncharacterized protein YyaL (SSP411 family)